MGNLFVRREWKGVDKTHITTYSNNFSKTKKKVEDVMIRYGLKDNNPIRII